MREMDFTMVRQDLVAPGQEVEVSEGILPVAGSFYYTIEPAVAMSANYKKNERLKSAKGVIKEIKETPRGFICVVEFDE